MAIARVRAKNIGAIRHNTDCQGHLTDRDGFAQGPGRGIEAGGMRKWIRTELQWGSGRSGVGDPGEVALGSGQSGVGAQTAWQWGQDGVALGPDGVALGSGWRGTHEGPAGVVESPAPPGGRRGSDRGVTMKEMRKPRKHLRVPAPRDEPGDNPNVYDTSTYE